MIIPPNVALLCLKRVCSPPPSVSKYETTFLKIHLWLLGQFVIIWIDRFGTELLKTVKHL